MASSEALHSVAFVKTYVLEERRASFIKATIIGELGTSLAVISNGRMLERNTSSSC
jgi:hypothetical protein